VGTVALTGLFLLHGDAVIQPAPEFPEDIRRQIEARDEDFVLSRTNSRAQSKVIDAATAELVKYFETPRTIAQAVAQFSRGRAENPAILLEEALPALRSLIGAGFLTSPDSPDGAAKPQSLDSAASISGWTILRCIQSLDDTEVYQVRNSAGSFAALKMARADRHKLRSAIAREASILASLGAAVTPGFIGMGEWNSRPYLLTEWVRGVESQTACGEFRDRSESRAELLAVGGAILHSYAYLHEHGVVHGDVHPRNVLIDARDAAKVIDFGLARTDATRTSDGDETRGGVGFFYDPEFARAELGGQLAPPPTFSGEQYSIAALLYLLVTGSLYLDFLLERRAMLRQIVESPMLPFARRSTPSWPEIEALLARALSKDPAGRFSSVAEFADAWRRVSAPQLREAAAASDPVLSAVLADILQASAVGGPWMVANSFAPPTTSINYGSAGLACGMLHIACAMDDAATLAMADVWSERSVRDVRSRDAFYSAELGVKPPLVGGTSIYHGPAGVYLTEALVAQAQGDSTSESEALRRFVEIVEQPCEVIDLALGSAGALVGCALLLKASDLSAPPFRVKAAREDVHKVGISLNEGMLRLLEGLGPITASKSLTSLGIAHGWAGLLYAGLSWCVATRAPLPASVRRRLRELEESAELAGRGLRWRSDTQLLGAGAYHAGWCNGSAGFVFLWTQAFRITGEPRYRELAEGAAWNAWETPTSNPTLCCGMAGQAYALLNYYRCSGEPAWLHRARDAARRAAALAEQGDPARSDPSGWRSHSLYKGKLGVAVLAADLAAPERARMPFFEFDG
jgi:serine/threonine-protein kinase